MSVKEERRLKYYQNLCEAAVEEANKSVFTDNDTVKTVNITKIKSLHSQLETNLNKMRECSEEYILALSDEGKFDNDDDGTEYRKTSAKWNDYVMEKLQVQYRLMEIVDSRAKSDDPRVNNSTHRTNKSSVSPPNSNLPTFDGIFDDWNSFWDTFEDTVHNDSTMCVSTKLNHLKNCLKGRAAKYISGTQKTKEDYDRFIKLLKDSFADPKRFIWNTALELANMESPISDLDKVSDFRADMEQRLLALESRGCKIEESGWLIAPLLCEKLPKNVQYHFEMAHDTSFPNLKQLRDGLLRVTSGSSKVFDQPDGVVQSIPKHAKGGKDQYKHNQGHRPKSHRQEQTQVRPNDVTNLNVNVNTKAREVCCVFCSSDKHRSTKCTEYKTPPDRIKRLGTLKRCLKCTSDKHGTSACKAFLYKCLRCKNGRHHTALCDKPAEPVLVSHSNVKSISPGDTLLPTALLTVVTKEHQYKLRGLFDQCAQRSFVTQDTVDKCGLQIINQTSLSISGFLETKETAEYNIVSVPVKVDDGTMVEIKAIVVEKLPSSIKTEGLTSIISGLKANKVILADPDLTGDEISDINLLVGADHYFKFIKTPQINGVNLIDSTLGYLLAGNIANENANQTAQVNSVQVLKLAVTEKTVFTTEQIDSSEETSIEEDIHKLWALEAIGITNDAMPLDEQAVCEEFNSSIFFSNGRYETSLPWKVDHKQLPTNYELCKKRLKTTVTKLSQTEGHLGIYDDLIREQLDMGFIEPVPDSELPKQNVHYLPHLAVIKNSATTPLRMVFDASAKANKQSPSLNDCLYSGPSLNNQLVDIMLKFRVDDYAISADISKAFLRVGLNEKDRDFTRFLWIKDNSYQTYRFKSVLFGATCSPFLLQATLRHHLGTYPSSKEICFLMEKFYVDNLVGSVSQVDELKRIYDVANQVIPEAGLPLREWVSNNPSLNQWANKDKIGIDIQETDSIKVLGLLWNFKEDSMNLRQNIFDSSILTKRSLLSNVSKIYDPLGLLSPVTVKGKILIQEAWKIKSKWDDAMPTEVQERWNKIGRDFESLHQIKFPRKATDRTHDHTLHIFCDASEKAYAATAYLVSSEGDSSLIYVKCRVSPLKKRSIPQLELTANLIAARISEHLTQTLTKDGVKISETVIWTDSRVALCWIKNSNSKDVYVRNRVGEINQFPHLTLLHVPTKENPADLATRGLTLRQFRKHLKFWFNGPDWLANKQKWPKQEDTSSPPIPEEITVSACITNTPAEVIKINQFSSLRKLVNTTKLVLKFIKILKSKRTSTAEGNSNVEVSNIEAMHLLIKQSQQTHLAEEVSYLKNRSNKVPCNVKTLGLYVDEVGIIRCTGRMQHSADMPYHTKYPILIPNKCHLATLIIRMAHEFTLHGGTQDTIAKVREEYWIPKVRQCTKKVKRKCYLCNRLEGPAFQRPAPPPLPEYRTSKQRPFEVTGVDLTGQILIMNPITKELDKFYVVLFTCTSTRAVHLEVVTELSAVRFMNAFRKFIARRSCPKLIISDNATNFKASASLLENLVSENKSISNGLSNLNCKWQFITPRAPQQGGFYERMIGTVKSSLKKTLFKKKINFDELQTIVSEVECKVNNRPLTYMDSSDPDSTEPLTPSHLLYGYRLNSLPTNIDLDYSNDADFHLDHKLCNERFNICSSLIENFQDVWEKTYLTSLREKHSFRTDPNRPLEDPIKVGDVVIIHNETPRCMWKLGRIIQIIPSNDGKVRIVKLKTANGDTMRSVDKLYPLEVHSDFNDDNHDTRDNVSDLEEVEDNAPDTSNPSGSRPTRRAAISSSNLLKKLIENDSI